MILSPSKIRERVESRKIFYGWWIVAAGFLNQGIGSALLQRSYGSYALLLRDEFGWSKTALSGAYSLQQVESGLLGPIQGWLLDRFGPRFSMRVGLILFGAGFIVFSQIESLSQFYIAYLMMAVGSTLCGFFPLTVVVVNWFEKRRSRALSTMQMGGAVGGLLVTAVALALETFGWRNTAFVSGIAIIALGLPLVQLVRGRPEDMGLTVDGRVEELVTATDGMAITAPAERDFTLREAMKTSPFWLISLGHGSALLIVSAVSVHMVLYLNEEKGYSLALASVVLTAITAAQIFGMVLGGTFGDRYDKRLIAMGCMAFHTLGLLLLAFAANVVMVFGFAIFHGAAWGLRGPLMGAMRADYFGRASFGQIMGVSSTIVTFGTIAGPLVAGVLADVTDSYALGFTILALLSGMGSVFFWLSKPPPRPLREPDALSRPSSG